MFPHNLSGSPEVQRINPVGRKIIFFNDELVGGRIVKGDFDKGRTMGRCDLTQVEENGIKNSLIFVESQWYRKAHVGIDYYGGAFIFNSLDLHGDVVYARYLGVTENARLMAEYPSRNYYLLKKKGHAKGVLVEIEKTLSNK